MSDAVTTLSDANFEEEIINKQKTALIDLWAPWCAPCKMVAPIVEELAEAYQGQAVVGKLNVDENPLIARRYGITSIPTLLFFKNGEAVDRMIGLPAGNAKKIIEEKLKSVIEED